MPVNKLPSIALIGRPNVGKSTLFNRFSKHYKAIVYELPGVTRDRKSVATKIAGIDCLLVDTPGFERQTAKSLQSSMNEQTLAAIGEAEVTCLVVDYKVGITELDSYFAKEVRKRAKNILLIANKCEKDTGFDKSYYQLGFGEPIPVSALHGLGLNDLEEALFSNLPKNTQQVEDTAPLRICIAGRPNCGKSTFVNSILGVSRLITGDMAGVTRDSIDIDWHYQGQNIKFTDTAGLRKKSKIDDKLDQLSSYSSISAIKLADAVILIVDAIKGLAVQDLRICNIAINEGKNLIMAFNKWDLIKDKADYIKYIEQQIKIDLPRVSGLPIMYLSATKQSEALPVVQEALKLCSLSHVKLPTSKLNIWLSAVTGTTPPPLRANGKRLKFKYMLQISQKPLKFKIFANSKEIPENYSRYLLRSLRESFNLPGIPIKLEFTASSNPYTSTKAI